VPRTRKEQMAAQRSARGDTASKMRQAMKTEPSLPMTLTGSPPARFLSM